eukprot:15253323-Ditylum_brightwellii.AAC.1
MGGFFGSGNVVGFATCLIEKDNGNGAGVVGSSYDGTATTGGISKGSTCDINEFVNLSPVSEGSNPDIENQDYGQSTMYSSDTPLAIEQ